MQVLLADILPALAIQYSAPSSSTPFSTSQLNSATVHLTAVQPIFSFSWPLQSLETIAFRHQNFSPSHWRLAPVHPLLFLFWYFALLSKRNTLPRLVIRSLAPPSTASSPPKRGRQCCSSGWHAIPFLFSAILQVLGGRLSTSHHHITADLLCLYCSYLQCMAAVDSRIPEFYQPTHWLFPQSAGPSGGYSPHPRYQISGALFRPPLLLSPTRGGRCHSSGPRLSDSRHCRELHRRPGGRLLRQPGVRAGRDHIPRTVV